MDMEASCHLVMCGKSSIEEELAQSLINNSSLRLPEIATLSSILHSEIEKDLKAEAFQVDRYFNSLKTDRCGRFLMWSLRLPSTHDIISQNFCELPVGAACVADVQVKGRGRSNNIWESPKGCLLFSFSIQMEDGRIVPLVQYVISLAMTEAIKEICDKNGMPLLDVKIKWPNDLYLDGIKVGGILCTSTYREKKFNVTAGIGLNIDNEKPTTCLNAMLQKLYSVSSRLQREDILAAFFNKFEYLFDIFIAQGFRPLEELYYRTWLHSGQRVAVVEKSDDQCVEKVATVQGLTSSGYLLAVGEDGQMCELHPDGNRVVELHKLPSMQMMLLYKALLLLTSFRLLQRTSEKKTVLNNIRALSYHLVRETSSQFAQITRKLWTTSQPTVLME